MCRHQSCHRQNNSGQFRPLGHKLVHPSPSRKQPGTCSNRSSLRRLGECTHCMFFHNLRCFDLIFLRRHLPTSFLTFPTHFALFGLLLPHRISRNLLIRHRYSSPFSVCLCRSRFQMGSSEERVVMRIFKAPVMITSCGGWYEFFILIYRSRLEGLFQGLTPNAFWKHHDEILRASRLDLTAIIESIVSASSSPSANVDWAILPSSITKTAGKLLICSNSDLPSPLPGSLPGSSPEATSVAFLQICTSGGRYPFSSDGHPSPLTNHLLLEAPEGKRGQLHFLQKVLPQSIAFISRHLHMDSDICISCDTGRDISVGVTLVALQKFFDDAGRLISNDSVSMSSRTYLVVLCRSPHLRSCKYSGQAIYTNATAMDHIKPPTGQPVPHDLKESKRVPLNSRTLQSLNIC